MTEEKHKYLVSQGWSEEKAKKYVDMQERGLSPSNAMKELNEGPRKEIWREPPNITQKMFGRAPKPTVHKEAPKKSFASSLFGGMKSVASGLYEANRKYNPYNDPPRRQQYIPRKKATKAKKSMKYKKQYRKAQPKNRGNPFEFMDMKW